AQARDLLDRLERELRATQLVGLVDLPHAVARDAHLEVTWDRKQRRGVLRWVEPDQDDRVRALAAAVPGRALRASVGADQHDRLRLTRSRRGKVGLAEHEAGGLVESAHHA